MISGRRKAVLQGRLKAAPTYVGVGFSRPMEGVRMPLDEQKERNRAIDIAVGQIEKQFRKGSIMRLGQKGPIALMESISTGSISIDYALGIGGLPRGRVV